ncbi:unnamed protein product, partial [Clonostachys rosea f. rosea IK726]
LTFKTASSKKRKISSQPSTQEDRNSSSDSPSSDSGRLLSCEPDDDPAFSFSASGPNTPSYLPADSLPVSSVPPRLQPSGSSLVSAEYASSTASSPSASVCADSALDAEDESGSAHPAKPRCRSPLRVSKRAIMNGDADLPQRSSSPLKRRASSMDPEAEQINQNGEQQTGGGLPRAMSIDPPDVPASGATNSESYNVIKEYSRRKSVTKSTASGPPSISEQIKTIETLLNASKETPLKEGDKAYLVSRTWVDKALALRGDSSRQKGDGNGDGDSDPLGPVNNSDIIEEVIKDSSGKDYVRLKPGSSLESFELFPEDAWGLISEWYGIQDGQQPIVRFAIDAAPDPMSDANVMYEFHPPIFRIHRLWSEVSPLPIEQTLKARNPPPLTLVRSCNSPAHAFLKDVKTLAGIPLERKVRLFSVPQTLPACEPAQRNSAPTPPDSPGRKDTANPQNTWPYLLLDSPSFAQVRDQRIKVDLADTTTNGNYNGSSTLQHWNLVTDQTLVLDEAIENAWVSTYTGRKGAKSGPARGNASGLSSKNNSGRNSPAPQGAGRGRALRTKPGRSLGAVGFHNLGNTCYMNSALQCVRSVEELTKYFLTDSHTEEINKTNPLGYNGRVALAYMNLLKEVYEEGRGSVSPRDFKTTVGRCRSTFQGWGQQDSQEFLGFLLDALQEDLSRIKKKPYIEKPDSTDEMINDPEAIRKMAEEVWDITRKRDDSVIADLFTGMYKSTLKCPECGKISITFDPFNNLTLPLPVEDLWHRTVKFFPLNEAPVKIDVELPKHSAVEALKQFISTRTGVPVSRLMGAEEFKERFFKIYEDQQDVSAEIQSTDLPTIHEIEAVPTNWPSKIRTKKYRSMLDIDSPSDATEWDDPRYETMVVPVFHRRPNVIGDGTNPPPHFIVLTREEASSYDTIQRKVLEKVATFSTWSVLLDDDDADDTNNADSDGVVVPSDVDSSGDGKVAARSVEGEEDMVDVTMTSDTKNIVAQSNHPLEQSKILKQFSNKRPSYVTNLQSFLDPELQNLFELSYFVDGSDGAVPTGWGHVDSNRTLPKIADRIPQDSEGADQPSPGSWASTPSGNEESSNDEAPKAESSQTRMMDEQTDEEDDKPRFSKRAHQKSGGKKKFKDHKTYGKKGNKRRERQAAKAARAAAAVKPQPMPPTVADGGPLIRLGEGLVVDWGDDAWGTVFGHGDLDHGKGAKTYVDPETLNDPALKISQRRRNNRRSRGITLEECLDEFERAEVLSEQDMWYCPRCKEHRRASKKFDLWKTPDILVAHLKRFSSSGYRRDKLDVLVDFPIDGLDLTSRVIEQTDGQNEIYDLIAVDDHYGGLGGGHYTAYAKNFMDGRWYNYNDSSVSQVSDPSSVVTSAAYLLFYRRRSSKPLGGPRFQPIFESFDKPNQDEDSDTEIGEDDQSDNGVSRNGTVNTGMKTTAIRPRADQASATSAIASLEPMDDDDDEQLPGYGEVVAKSSLHPSIEDEGVDMTDSDPAQSNPIIQGWSFSGISGNGREGSTGADIGSDDVQHGSTDDERMGPQNFDDQDVEMASVTAELDSQEQLSVADGNAQTSWNRKDIISVPAKTGSDRDSDEVAEIHIEGESRGPLAN